MQITALGHAGFCVETEHALLIADPWLSPHGAFDAAWFQFPQNHHMAAFVQEKLQTVGKQKFLYISHEHKDHFDLAFLQSLTARDFTLLLPRFRRPELRNLLNDYRCQRIITCADREQIAFPDGFLQVYVEDSELNRDSALLVKADGLAFLNLNDCKIHDKLAAIVQEQGRIDVFTAQFSGAIWHPTCYEYQTPLYEAIARKKLRSKFEAVARAIEIVQPRLYLASAGPACFLDPQLLHLNFEPVNIFPRAPQFFAYLQKRLRHTTTQLWEPMPGDVLDVASGTFVHMVQERVTDDNFADYIKRYAALYAGYFHERQQRGQQQDTAQTWQQLRQVFAEKLQHLTLHERVPLPMYVQLSDVQDRLLRVDFPRKQVEDVQAVAETNFYKLTTASWELRRVLEKKLTWEDFMLSFRFRLNREPDVYQAVIHGFLVMEPEDMQAFCEKVLQAEAQQERTIVDAGGCRYAINRFCPHQGADLTQGWIEQGQFLVCPRHRWHFDLTKQGQCTTNDTSVQAILLEED